MCLLAAEEEIELHPLFVNYGQRGLKKELDACRRAFAKHGLPSPSVIDVSGYGAFYPSGLTSPNKDIFYDAFLPGRNLLFLMCGAAHAYKNNCTSIAIGLLSEENSIFPDQTHDFITKAESVLAEMLGAEISVLTPLMNMTKHEVIALAEEKNIHDTWSCHADGEEPCGKCIACREFQ